MASKSVPAVKTLRRPPVEKRTSIGLKHRPKNKHKRKRWKDYNRQGRP